MSNKAKKKVKIKGFRAKDSVLEMMDITAEKVGLVSERDANRKLKTTNKTKTSKIKDTVLETMDVMAGLIPEKNTNKKAKKSPDLYLTLVGQVLVEEKIGNKIISSYPISGECVLTILNQQLDEAMKLFCSGPEFRKKIEQDVKDLLK